ncbi:MAG: transposase [Sphingomonadaceae bacterium]
MTRPLRLQFAGALYHVTARGDRRQHIYLDDSDHLAWLAMMAHVCQRHRFRVHSFCMMPNHYHLLLETLESNLARGMRQLNGQYSQYFNRRHDLVGHLFQGRYKAILVQKESYLLELSRYVVLNPVRAKLCTAVDDWRWSSYPLTTGRYTAPDWLDIEWLLSRFSSHAANAIKAYIDFVRAGISARSPLADTRNQLLLGDRDFVARHQPSLPAPMPEIHRLQRQSQVPALQQFQQHYPNRHVAMAQAYLSGAYSMSQIAAHFHVSYRTVSRAVAKQEANPVTKSCL